MRRPVPFAAVLLAMAGVTLGCYESDFPLGPPRAALDPHLVGHWRCVEALGSKTQAFDLTVARRSEQQYDVTMEMTGEDTLRYRGHPTDVGGQSILNLQEMKAGKDPAVGRWDFVRASLLKPNVLDVEVMDDALFKGKELTAATQRALVEANAGQPSLFFDYCVCTRAMPDKP